MENNIDNYIKAVDNVFLDKGIWSHQRESWSHLKEVLKTSHNTGRPKLLAIIDSALSCINDGELVGAHYHVDKLRKQLRAGA